jgi:hypothetical protein
MILVTASLVATLFSAQVQDSGYVLPTKSFVLSPKDFKGCVESMETLKLTNAQHTVDSVKIKTLGDEISDLKNSINYSDKSYATLKSSLDSAKAEIVNSRREGKENAKVSYWTGVKHTAIVAGVIYVVSALALVISTAGK